MSVHLKAFTEHFAFTIPSECSAGEKAFSQNFRKIVTSYIPIISTIANILILKNSSKPENPHDQKRADASYRALTARSIICLTGLGIILLPIDIIGTIIKACDLALKNREIYYHIYT